MQNSTYKDYEVIITSSHPNYALQAYNFSALHFLEKPISINNLKVALERFKKFKTFENINEKIQVAKELLNNRPTKIMLPDMMGMKMYNLDEIIYFQANSNYTKLFFSNNKPTDVSRTLGKIDEILADTQFCRVHNSYIVNINYIKAISKGKLTNIELTNGDTIPISKERKEMMMDKLKFFAKVV